MEEKPGLFQRARPRAALIFGFAAAAYLGISYYLQRSDPTLDQTTDLLLDVVLFLAGLVIWLVFFAQFVLPVNKVADRLNVVDRLVAYLTGRHGPAIFIENGFVRESVGESMRQGAGVMWLDSASAAVLRTESRFTRTVGPGVHFTNYGEYLEGTHDLHIHTQSIGPEEMDDPFTVQKNHASYQQMQERRWATSGTTRDGIEVLASIGVVFRIKSTEREGGTEFGFDEVNSEKAIRESITRGAKHIKPVASPLPARMAVDIWREYLSKFRLNELFEIVDWGDETTVQFIASQVKNRLSQDIVISLDDFGRPKLMGKPDEGKFKKYCELRKAGRAKEAENMCERVPSQEFKILNAMGLEINAASIKRLSFAPEVEERLISQWTALWLKNANKERDQVENKRKQAETTAIDEAVKEFALNATPDLIKRITQSDTETLSPAETLFLLMRSTVKGMRRNSDLFSRTSNEQRDLIEIYNKLREKEDPK